MSTTLLKNGQRNTFTEENLFQLDSQDPLSHFRERFVLPERGVYLDGESGPSVSV